jgi:hypothetical protein
MRRVRKGRGMAKPVSGMNRPLDGCVDPMAFTPGPTLFRHFIGDMRGLARQRANMMTEMKR